MLPNILHKINRHQIPLKVNLEILSPCNLRCRHCYVDHKKPNLMRGKRMFQLLDDLAAAGCMILILTGGEIGLHPEIFSIIAYARKLGFQIRMTTTTTRWDADDCQRLAALGVYSAAITVYAKDPQIHDAITQTPGSWQITTTNMHRLRALGLRVTVITALTRINIDHVPELAEYLAQSNIPFKFNRGIRRDERLCEDPQTAMQPSTEQLQRFHADPRIQKLRPYIPSNPQTLPKDAPMPCGVGTQSAFIKSTGEMFPCIPWPQSAGNVFKNDLLSIFRNSEVFQTARNLRMRDLGQCGGCQSRADCRPCAATLLQERGNTQKGADFLCQDTQIRAQQANAPLPPKRTSLHIVSSTP